MTSHAAKVRAMNRKQAQDHLYGRSNPIDWNRALGLSESAERPDVGRHIHGIRCTSTLKVGHHRNMLACTIECNGYAPEVEPNEIEEKAYGCGRKGCCAVAFVCLNCETRYVGSKDAPEMD